MAFSGNYPIRTKFVIDNPLSEQVSNFQYLGCGDISYEENGDINNKIKKFKGYVVQLQELLRIKY